ncbi:hypothetical protein Tco_1351499 [Tanacetum coccineum]
MAPSGSPFFIFDVHYDGTFNFMPLRFEKGLVYNWSVHKDSELDLATASEFLREETKSIILYELFFKLPQCQLDKGLKIIENDMDLLAMYDYAHSYAKIHMKTVRKYAGNMSVEELVSWAEEEETITSKGKEKVCDDDITMTSVVDKGKGLVDKGKGKMVNEGNVVKSRKSARSKNSGIVIEENVNPSFSEDDDSDSDLDMEQMFQGSTDMEQMFHGNTDSESEYSNKSVDYFSEGEDELISLKKRNIKAKKS